MLLIVVWWRWKRRRQRGRDVSGERALSRFDVAWERADVQRRRDPTPAVVGGVDVEALDAELADLIALSPEEQEAQLATLDSAVRA